VNRWWANPELSAEILKSVDDSDVVNGVGVAVLGYHGLAMGVLKPLVTQTLVDTHTVRKALLQVDLQPIAKALSEATKPVMGDASERYGKLLADAIHEKAVASTERLLHTWTNNGMPWPNAIERAAEVHGVPVERLGRYASVMKAATVNPHIRADYADRELMTYASVMGSRESLISSELISKQKSEFEELHPRASDGRFTDKSEVLDLRAKLNKMKKFKAAREVGSQVKRGTFDFARSKTAGESRTKIAPRTKVEPKKMEVQTTGDTFKTSFRHSFRKPDFKLNDPSGDCPTVPTFFVNGDVYIPVNASLLNQIKKQSNLFTAWDVKNHDGNGELEAFGKDGFSDYVDIRGLKNIVNEGTVLLKCSYTPVHKNRADVLTNSSGNPHTDDFKWSTVAPKATFRLVTGGPEPRSLMSLINAGKHKLHSYSDDFEDDFVPNTDDFKVYEIALVNDDPDLWEEDISKNLSDEEREVFNVEHPRAVNGQFTDKNVTSLKAKLDKRNKMARQREIGQKAKQGNFDFKESRQNQADVRQKISALRQEPVFAETKFKQSFKTNFKMFYRDETPDPIKFGDSWAVIVPYGMSPMPDLWPWLNEKAFSERSYKKETHPKGPTEIVSGNLEDDRTALKVFKNTHGSSLLIPREQRTSPGRALSPVVGNIINHADRREPEKIIKVTGTGSNSEDTGEWSFETPEQALEAANNSKQRFSLSNSFLMWQPEALINENGEYDAILAGYNPEEKYQLIVGSHSDLWEAHYIANENPEEFAERVKIVPSDKDVSNLQEFLSLSDSDEIIDEVNSAIRDKGTNPPIELYEIKVMPPW